MTYAPTWSRCTPWGGTEVRFSALTVPYTA